MYGRGTILFGEAAESLSFKDEFGKEKEQIKKEAR